MNKRFCQKYLKLLHHPNMIENLIKLKGHRKQEKLPFPFLIWHFPILPHQPTAYCFGCSGSVHLLTCSCKNEQEILSCLHGFLC